MRRFIGGQSPALVVACLALLVALGGTSYATVLNVPRNSVGPANIKRNAVGPQKLAPNAVRTGHVLNGSLLVDDFRPGQIPQGPKGDKGDTGAPGLSGLQIVTAARTVANATSNVHTANCPTGKRVLGGGATTSSISASAGPYVYASIPNGPGGWFVAMAASPNQSWTMTVYAVCANVT